MKEKKLPTIWALLTPRVCGAGTYRLGETYIARDDAKKLRKSWETVVRYTPAKPAKVCRWTKRRDGYWEWCDPNFPTIHRPLTYCGRCGGKIKVTR